MPLEDDNNRIAFDRLNELIQSGQVIAFIGSGCSMKQNYFSWKNLVLHFQNYVRANKPGYQHNLTAAYLTDADRLVTGISLLRDLMTDEEYARNVHEAFKPKEDMNCEFHKNLMAIKFRHFVTTNYDVLLEHNSPQRNIRSFPWNNQNKLQEFLRYLPQSSTGDISYIFHLHGIYDDISSVILTKNEYDRVYVSPDFMADILSTLVLTFRICFVGYGMGDHDIMQVFRKVRLQYFAGELQNHFAFISAEDDTGIRSLDREMYRRNYGVEPIFFSEVDGDNRFEELDNLIFRLKEASPANSLEAQRKIIDENSDLMGG